MIIKYSYNNLYKTSCKTLWCRGVLVITAAQLPSTKLEFRSCVGSNPACGVLEIFDGRNL